MVIMTAVLGKLVEPLIGVGGIDLIFLLPVTVASGRYGLRPGLVAGLASALCYNFFFLPPLYTFTIAEPQSVLTLFVLIGIASPPTSPADSKPARCSARVARRRTLLWLRSVRRSRESRIGRRPAR
jgi:two-component system sensor histidine kinase KdpD